MTINGKIFGINDPTTFFTQVLTGQHPSAGYVEISGNGMEVTVTGYNYTGGTATAAVVRGNYCAPDASFAV